MRMSDSGTSAGTVALREVTATFGRKSVGPDPAWELEYSAWLRSSHAASSLVEMFARFREGEGQFDSLMRRVLLRALCRRMGNDVQVGPGVVLKHPETMEIGDCVFIGAQAMIQGRFDGTCRIGNHVWIGPQAYFDARNLQLEDYVGWGPGAKVLGSTHSAQPVSVPIITTDLLIKPVKIGYGADVGMNASILPGVHIGAHAIVGAGSVVTKDVPEYAVVAGVPAQILRFRGEK
jgi:acetyltransferase-like isoleucine patch superfamily enzyme